MKLLHGHPGDEKIIQLLKSHGTEMNEGIKLLYRHYFSTLKNHILTNNGSEQDAEDIFQDVIIAFINIVRAGKFRGDSSIKTFLFALNRNQWLNEMKKRERKSAREEKYGDMTAGNSDAAFMNLELRQSQSELLKIMSELGDACKQILLLFYYENRSMTEIAASMNYENEQVARNKKFKCLKKMEQLVQSNNKVYHTLKNYLHE